MAKILLVDDDKDLVENLKDWLESERHAVEVAHTAEQASSLINALHYDLIILDWRLPKMSGVEWLKQYRTGGGQVPVLMLTGKDMIDDKLSGLDAGCDDYLTKPFHFEELSARARALLRRPPVSLTPVLTVGDLCCDTATCVVTLRNKVVDLLPKEYALLSFLMSHPGQIFDADSILDRVWNSESDVGPETVRTTIMRLRKKIDHSDADSYIKTIRGIGYKIEQPGLS